MLKRRIILGLTVLCCGYLFAAADMPFSVESMRLEFTPTPVPAYKNTTSRMKASSGNRWLRIITVFIPSASAKTNTVKEPWYDDVTMEGTLVISRMSNGKTDSYIVLNGKTRYFTINADGKEHIACFYVPPKLLERYCGTLSGGTEKLLRIARVAFYGPGRVLLGEGYWMLDSSGKKGRFLNSRNPRINAARLRMKEYGKNYSNVMTLQGGLYSKEKTPWHHADYDFYDLIYDNVLQQDSGSIKK